MNKQDLKSGDFYVEENPLWHYKYICIYKVLGKNGINVKINSSGKLGRYLLGSENSLIRLATPEEKHWLDKCIELNKFISKEEAMKSFVPEYVKCDNNGGSYSDNFTINKIYKVIKEDNNKHLHLVGDNNNIVTVFKGLNHPIKGIRATYFTPSTKEEYDAQFVVKEPEFVLPEKWCIKGNEIVRQYFERNKNGWRYTHLHNYYHSENLIPGTGWKMNIYKDKGHTEITFEQFKKYVLKEDELKQPDINAPIEEILEYCKKKYPAGTKVKSRINNNNIFTIIATPFILKDNIVSYDECGSVFLFKKSQTIKYSEIIEPVKQELFREVKVQLESKVYSLDEITKALTKEYDKVDVEDILKVIKQIK